MLEQRIQLGLFGGSFDPIHLGHIAIAKAALEQQRLDQIHFITAQQNPQKPSLLDARARHQLVEVALKDENFLLASDIELNRAAPSYSSDTISSYQELCPNVDLYWVMGADAFQTLATWQKPEKFSELNIIVYPRAGVERLVIPSFLSQDKVHFLKMPEIAISSSSIRTLMASPLDDLEDKLKNLVPERIKSQLVEHYN